MELATASDMLRCLIAALFLFSACAAADDGLTPDQKRMRACNTRAKEKSISGAERSHFMTNCLKGHDGDGPALTPHQRKNQTCTRRADNRGLEGAERRGFMSDCARPQRAKEQTAQRERIKNCNRRAADRRLDGEEKRKFVAGCLDQPAAAGG
jgi:hypothetical protein